MRRLKVIDFFGVEKPRNSFEDGEPASLSAIAAGDGLEKEKKSDGLGC